MNSAGRGAVFTLISSLIKLGFTHRLKPKDLSEAHVWIKNCRHGDSNFESNMVIKSLVNQAGAKKGPNDSRSYWD